MCEEPHQINVQYRQSQLYLLCSVWSLFAFTSTLSVMICSCLPLLHTASFSRQPADKFFFSPCVCVGYSEVVLQAPPSFSPRQLSSYNRMLKGYLELSEPSLCSLWSCLPVLEHVIGNRSLLDQVKMRCLILFPL